MITSRSNFAPFILAAALSLVMLFGFAVTARANPSSHAGPISTSAATSTPSFMTPGTATTTTQVYDSYASTTRGGLTTKADSAFVTVIFTASSTATVLGWMVEYSQDNIDWYRNYVIDPNQMGTTTPAITIGATPVASSWKFASSSVGGAAVLGTNNVATAAFLIPTPARYTRIVFYLTGGNGAVWAQITPIKQLN
jgi:hypothetical protein